MDQRGGTVSQGGGNSGGGISQRGGCSHNWGPDGNLVCVSVRSGKGGGDCSLDYCWGGGICWDGGGGSVCCDGGSAEVASRCGGEEERQKNL